MSAETLVLPPEHIPGPYELVQGRCVAELVVRVLRIPVLWVRLRVISARLDLPDRPYLPATDADADADAVAGRLVAEVAAKPVFASLPFPRRWALRSLPRTARIQLTASGLPRLVPGVAARVPATVSAPGQSWSVSLHLRLACVDESSVVLAACGPVSRSGRARALDRFLFVDAAAEFVR